MLISREELKETMIEVMEQYQHEFLEDEIWTIKETAGFLKVSVPTVRSMIVNKEIPYFQKGQIIRLNRSQVVEWMKTNQNVK
ncbi:helix-turn-helix domain-containing protein [Neobacillus niacini]|uniref:helix-turn-helix domain-containing protein n=1 Tax=Neobacillus niacini TaxID=86668 RepID=UPI003983799F